MIVTILNSICVSLFCIFSFRLLLNPNVRARVAEELATPAAKAYDVLVTPQAVERLIQSASRLRFNLMKNAVRSSCAFFSFL